MVFHRTTILLTARVQNHLHNTTAVQRRAVERGCKNLGF